MKIIYHAVNYVQSCQLLAYYTLLYCKMKPRVLAFSCKKHIFFSLSSSSNQVNNKDNNGTVLVCV